MVRTFVSLAALALLCMLQAATSAEAQSISRTGTDECAVFRDIVGRGEAVSPKQIGDVGALIACLVPGIPAGRDAAQGTAKDPQAEARFIALTGVLRSAFAIAPERAIAAFRDVDSLEIIDTLAFGARHTDRAIRLNATLILGNVIDNTNVCVAIDHLYDTSEMQRPERLNGRANLISVVSVVAPWAYSENYENIRRVSDFLRKEIQGADDVDKTRSLLDNLDERLAYQQETTQFNRTQALPSVLADCREWKPVWAGDRLSYGATPPG